MRKIKISIILFLILALLATGACFPKIVAAIQDKEIIGEASFDPIQSVQLEIRKDIPSLGKLAMMSKMDVIIEIPENKASMTAQEVMTAARAALQPYINGNLLDNYSEWDVDMAPCLVQVPDMAELQGVFWQVTIAGDPEIYSVVDLMIDDETGKILRLHYAGEAIIDESIREDILLNFTHIFFTSLGIDDYSNFCTSDLDSVYIGDNAVATRYRFGDVVYGEINVDLYVYQHGFYTEFPDLYGEE